MLAKVYVVGRAFNGITAATFNAEEDYRVVNRPEDADILVWTGGEDINPYIYGEKPIAGTYFTNRDESDLSALNKGIERGQYLIGICRGAQLLNCTPNKGKLWQDCNNHGSGIHRTFDCTTGKWIRLNSVHHQQMRLGDGAELLAWAKESTYKKSEHEEFTWSRPSPESTTYNEDEVDPEIVWYPKTRSFLIQSHPEFGHNETTHHFFRMLDTYYWNKEKARELRTA